MLKTRLTERFGLQYPIMSSPMAGHSSGAFAAAVSNAGGFGLFGAAGMTPEHLQSEIEAAQSQTQQPFGIGFITMFLDAEQALFEIALRAKAAAIALSFEDPARWIERAHEAGIPVICQVQSLDTAREAVEAGADVIVAQGREAGGHTGAPGLLPLLEEVLDTFPEQIVLAAGGIASGRSLAAVLAAGADGVWMGTRLLATREAIVPDEHKRLIVESRAEDTVFTPVYDIVAGGRWPRDIEARLLRNRFAAEWEGRERELEDRIAEVRPRVLEARAGDPWQNQAVYMGTGVNAIHSIEPVADVMRSICEDAERRLSR